MNKRNKPASLTSSLLARKGEAEPAIEPYSFLEPDLGPPKESEAQDRAEPDNGGDAANGGMGGASGAMAGMNSDRESSPGAGSAEGADGDASGGDAGDFGDVGEQPAPNREVRKDRRLLLFIYAVAALTGVAAVVMYAGGWFFDTRETGGPAPEKPAQTAASPSGSDATTPKAGAAAPDRLGPSTEAQPPAPPVPIAPARDEAAVAREAEETAPAQGGGDAATTAPAKETASETGGAAQAQAEPTPHAAPAEAPPATPPTPAQPERQAAAAGPAAEPGTPAPAPEIPPAESKTPPPAPEKPPAAAKAAPRATATPAPSATGRYYVQLASVTSEAGAKRFWGKVKAKYPDILGEYDLTVQKRVVANRGTFYRVQVGRFASFKDVRRLCDMLKARGQTCLPVKR